MWSLQFTVDGPGSAWIDDLGVPFKDFSWAVATLRMCSRTDHFNAWRLVDSNGVQVVAISPVRGGES